jgi:hypothetical protein
LELNTAEGTRRLATIIRWIEDGIGILCCFGGVANLLFGTTPFDDRVAVAAFGLFFGALFAGGGRAIGLFIQGLPKSE